MSPGILGKKIGMTQIFRPDGQVVPVTLLKAGPCMVVQRHHFAGGPESHGSMFHRAPGSIGSSSWPSRVWKNKRLPGHMGDRRVTAQGLEVIDVRPEEHLLFVRGAVPGARGSLVAIQKSKKAS